MDRCRDNSEAADPALDPGAATPTGLRGLGVLQVEPTDHCNLSCRMCAPHHEGWDSIHGVPKGFLDPELWTRILHGMVADGVELDHLIFQWLGDPSLHPQLPALVGRAARELADRVGYLRIDTNGILLTPPKIDALLEEVAGAGDRAPPLLVVFTLDAHSPGTYLRVKGGDHLPRVRRHIRHLVRQRRRLGARVNLQLQFVVQEGNAHEAADFHRYWLDLLACQGDISGGEGPGWHDELMFKRLSVGGGSAGQAAADALYERTMDEAGIRGGPAPGGQATVQVWTRRPWQRDDAHAPERGPCPGLWMTPVIRHDGALLMCCADLQGELVLGNLDRAGFLELWEGERALRHRLAHLDGRFEGVCAGCGGINWYDLDPERTERTRQRAAKLGLDG